ncbi:hypothetical protein [Limnofasciculus baicalensis]|uniref:Uncharacterized protein n=1 Tax=Limnofasciculus baicalensis BBK-W-15 TaxID=2699891 RepID=A0AAE3GSR9_9CYAN|nr:hypothetical protein [Limnofasciculus baicalensis]MCP2729282.1 hypothetical protein [Limnofasciculus baicalensis BBK-W-15]
MGADRIWQRMGNGCNGWFVDWGAVFSDEVTDSAVEVAIPFTIRYPSATSVTHPLPIRYPSATHPLPIRYIRYPSVAHPLHPLPIRCPSVAPLTQLIFLT